MFNSEGILGLMGQTTNRTTPTLNYVRCHPILHKDYYRLEIHFTKTLNSPTCLMRCSYSMCKQNSHIMLAVTVHAFSQILVLKENSAYNEMGGETTPRFRIIHIHPFARIVCIDIPMQNKVRLITTSVVLDPFLLSK